MSGSRLVLPAQQPVQSTGLPYAGGKLFFYVSGTTTPANTYQDQALSVPNTNPVILDSAGDAGNVFLDGTITYKVVLEDSSNNLVWTFDPVNSFALGNIQSLVFAGTTTGTANAQNLAGLPPVFDGQTIIFTAGFTNVSSATLNTGGGAVLFNQASGAGPVILTGSEVVVGNTYFATYKSSLNASAGGWQLLGAVSPLGIGSSAALFPFFQSANLNAAYSSLGGYVPPPSGRLTLTSGVPVLAATVSGATSVLYTPYLGNQIPVWNSTSSLWGVSAFAELTCLLSDATRSPAAAVANSVYDLFVWSSSGILTLSRGPVWTNTTTRSAGTAVSRLNGILVNSVSITNGPAANIGVYVGTIATDAGAATVTFNPVASGAGGPTNGVWVGLWNQYNRVYLTAVEQDTTASWSYATATTRASNASNNNRISVVVGQIEDSINVLFSDSVLNNVPTLAIGVDSTTTTSGNASTIVGNASVQASGTASYAGLTQLGLHFYQALERTNGATTTFYGAGPTIGQAYELVAQTRY